MKVYHNDSTTGIKKLRSGPGDGLETQCDPLSNCVKKTIGSLDFYFYTEYSVLQSDSSARLLLSGRGLKRECHACLSHMRNGITAKKSAAAAGSWGCHDYRSGFRIACAGVIGSGNTAGNRRGLFDRMGHTGKSHVVPQL